MSVFGELKRRNVFRVGVAYAAVGWLLVQVADVVFPFFGAPDWVLHILVVMLLLGLPVTLVFAWVFELTPEGVKREKDVDRDQLVRRARGEAVGPGKIEKLDGRPVEPDRADLLLDRAAGIVRDLVA